MTFLIFLFFSCSHSRGEGTFYWERCIIIPRIPETRANWIFGEKSDSRVLASLAVDETSPLTLAVRIGCQDSVPFQGVCILSTEPFLPNRYVPGVGVSALLLAS